MGQDNTIDAGGLSRRQFLKSSAGAAIGAGVFSGTAGAVPAFEPQNLQVWSCGGLAEAFIPANRRFDESSGPAAASAPGLCCAPAPSCVGIRAPRVLRGLGPCPAVERWRIFQVSLCYPRYVMVTPKGNPAGIRE